MKRSELIRELRDITGPEGVISEPEQLLTYESDGLRNYRNTPVLVVLPSSTEQVRGVVRLCHSLGIPVVPRGSGTGLSAGGAAGGGGGGGGAGRGGGGLVGGPAGARAGGRARGGDLLGEGEE